MIPHPLAAAATARPAHPALRFQEQVWTYAELAQRVAALAGALQAAGVRRGDTVALGARATPDFVVELHAVGWLGAVADVREEAPPLDHVGCEPISAAVWGLEDPRLVLHTSGTTGTPRAVPLLTRQLLFSAMGSALRLGHLPSDRWVACLPLHHIGGLSILLRCAWYATTVELHERFDAQAVSDALDAGAPLISLVPTQLLRVLDARSDRPFPPSLRAILLGGAPSSAALLDRCRAIHAPVSRSWGMTETASQVATTFPGDLDTPGAPPLAFARVHADDAGLLHVLPPHAAAPLLTSDRGELRDGRVLVHGRADDLLISGGENLSPAEIEAVLEAHPAVREAAVIGIPDPVWGQRPAAFLVGVPVPDEQLRAWCRERLAPYKAPDRFTWLDVLPRTALGKLQRAALRER